MSAEERSEVLALLNSAPYQDQAPREVYADLLEAGVYLCSWRTMYRILHEYAEVRERRRQLSHPTYARPELLATAPNQLWTWDITKLRGPVKGRHYYLYVIIDVFSRYVVGWMLAAEESASLAHELIAQSCASQGIQAKQLTIHADNGGAMIAKSVAQLMQDLGVHKSHSRPHVPDDNPFSEAQFKTLKYSAAFPGEFSSLAEARQWLEAFFTWYNHEHHHTGIGLFTPAAVHTEAAVAIQQQREAVMQQAYAAHPERFVKGAPVLPPLPTAVWINPPRQPGEPITPSGQDDGQCDTDHVTLVVPVWEDRATLGKSTPNALSTRDSLTVQITHPTHPLRGQTFAILPLFGGKPEPTQLLIALPNGERRLIPAEWTGQAPRINYPPGACFIAERLLHVRQRLDDLLAQDDEQTILMATGLECDEPGGHHANRRNHPLGPVERRATSSDHRHSCSDAIAPVDSANGGGA